jgi:hypothetical protein
LAELRNKIAVKVKAEKMFMFIAGAHWKLLLSEIEIEDLFGPNQFRFSFDGH